MRMKSWSKYVVPAVGYTFAAAIGYAIATQVPWVWYALPLAAKTLGRGESCPWSRVFPSEDYMRRRADRYSDIEHRLQLAAEAPSLALKEWRLPGIRSFWLPNGKTDRDSRSLLAELLADHQTLDETWRRQGVQPGDIVLDCGAHVGVFTDIALRRGARMVVAIEPDGQNLECLARNFKGEIAAGRVVVVPKGVWNSEGVLELHRSDINSARGSVVLNEPGTSVRVEVTTIDRIVQTLKLPRVDYIKLDIEGAERQALRGAAATLQNHRPRLFVSAYHQPNDPQVLPRLIRTRNADYTVDCGPCEFDSRNARLYALFAK